MDGTSPPETVEVQVEVTLTMIVTEPDGTTRLIEVPVVIEHG